MEGRVEENRSTFLESFVWVLPWGNTRGFESRDYNPLTCKLLAPSQDELSDRHVLEHADITYVSKVMCRGRGDENEEYSWKGSSMCCLGATSGNHSPDVVDVCLASPSRFVWDRSRFVMLLGSWSMLPNVHVDK